jgi:hypothetical protein
MAGAITNPATHSSALAWGGCLVAEAVVGGRKVTDDSCQPLVTGAPLLDVHLKLALILSTEAMQNQQEEAVVTKKDVPHPPRSRWVE